MMFEITKAERAPEHKQGMVVSHALKKITSLPTTA
jgi:hypothetical protein